MNLIAGHRNLKDSSLELKLNTTEKFCQASEQLSFNKMRPPSGKLSVRDAIITAKETEKINNSSNQSTYQATNSLSGFMFGNENASNSFISSYEADFTLKKRTLSSFIANGNNAEEDNSLSYLVTQDPRGLVGLKKHWKQMLYVTITLTLRTI